MTTFERIEDFAIGMGAELKKAKKELRFVGNDDARRAACQAEVDEARKSFLQALKMYREAMS